ncbi:DUF1707 domain-containing protein [Actinoallomurus spadix]|uniref:DUF1707 domain-containing protein n=1 Tax=Actinoallomurus spadix TaxID=79912 RepID=A0ABN0W7G6_9ACTN|nr:DUF1707 domain-containing protein [Actinoallomurus spadix]MCO5990680.1 DUF1707 domain-containing protein [Actinoallomurus spadix]
MEPYHEPAAERARLRASDQDRDETVRRLQAAFAEGRLTDGEFDERMRGALAARTYGDLAGLLADLPADTAPVAPRPAAPAHTPRPGRHSITFKDTVRLAGRWRVPGTFRAVVYKGGGVIDLRAAELTEPVTTILAVAYKSDIEFLVPPGVRIEASGFGVTRDEEWTGELDPGAPVVHIRAFAYKGRVETRTMPRR